MRILVVEDEPAAARVLAQGLREHAYAVDVAADGEAAREQAGLIDYDLIVLDVLLPRINGLALCREILEAHGFEYALESTAGEPTRFSLFFTTPGRTTV